MATPMMPDAPEPQNRMMSAAPPAAPMQPPAGPNMMQQGQAPGGPVAPPQAPAGPQPTPEEIVQARHHISTIMDGLLSLTTKPRGDLTKKSVFDAASTMISEGAFSTPAAKQALIVQLAELPDDEPSLRKALGSMLLSVASHRSALHQVFGAA